jgi:chitin synthase
VGMTPGEFCSRYNQGLQDAGVVEGSEREVIEQARKVYGLGERDLVLGVHKVRLLVEIGS